VVKNVSSVKKEGIAHDNFSYIVFDFKTVPDTRQTGGLGTGQKLKFLSSTEPLENILSSAQVA
jgi:hypothetical protein